MISDGNLPRILMVVNNYSVQRGGISALVMNLSKGLVSEGYKVSIHSVGGFKAGRLVKYASLFINGRDYDIIHCHGSANLGFLPCLGGVMTSLLYQKPLVVTYHSSPTSSPFIRNNLLVRIVIKRCTVITTPSEETARTFRYCGVRSIAIPNILDVENWPFRDRLRIKPAIIWTRNKNAYRPELAIESFLILKEKSPNATLTMCGSDATETIQKKYKNTPGIRLLGHVPRDELPNIMDEADIWLNTMRHESFGYSAYEAMAMGLAIVSVESSALMSRAGPKAITFSESDSAESLADAIEGVLVDQEQTIQRIQHAIKISEKLRWESIYPVWRKVYDRALS